MSDDKKDDYNICLSAIGKPRMVVSISETDTVQDVKRMAQDHFDLEQASLKAGFPPRPVTSVVEKARSVFSKNERVVVEANGGGDQKTKKENGATATSSTPLASTGRSKRAAAKAATASFKDVIRAQDHVMRQEQERTKKRSRPNNSTTRNNSTSRNNNNAAAQRRMAQMPGRRLADGAGIGPQRRRSRKNAAPKLSSQDDVSFALLSALNSGGGSGKVGQVLRGAMRRAVSNQYEASRAVVRVAAVQANKYSIQLKNDRLFVEYSKGLEGRGYYEEVVDLVPHDALVAVITAIYNNNSGESGGRDMLRPTHLAQLSPRVFWSLLHDITAADSVEDALEHLIPALDWSFLHSRTKTLSEKAKENLRQEQQQDAQESGKDMQAAEDAVHAVEDAMEQLHQYDQGRQRERAARAALARLAPTTSSTTEWKPTTPNELDRDELGACMVEGGGDETTPAQVETWIQALVESGFRNWRELANSNPSTVGQAVQLDAAQVEPWLDYAQQQSVEEIIVEICDDNIQAVEMLRDEARSGTPKDLAHWRSLPDMLYQEASSLQTINVTVQELAKWCQRAHDVLQEHQWLQWYATPVASS